MLPLLAADSPLIPGERPQRIANIHAGEGPAWDGTRYLYFTGGGRISRIAPPAEPEVFREGGAPNGLIFDRQGRLIVCESSNRRVIRLDPDGSTTVLAETYEGKRFNSPNDLAIDSHGRIYFSDPRYGKRDGMEMFDAAGRTVEGVYRIDAPGKVVRVLGREVDRPNGLYVSPRGRYLYVADNNNGAGGVRKLWRFALRKDGSVNAASKKLLFDWKTSRGPDGLDMDEKGRIYVAAGRNQPRPPQETAEPYKGGVYILSPSGKLLDVIEIPDDEVTNCAFGGADRRTLFITAGGNLWMLRVKTAGARQKLSKRAEISPVSKPTKDPRADHVHLILLEDT